MLTPSEGLEHVSGENASNTGARKFMNPLQDEACGEGGWLRKPQAAQERACGCLHAVGL